MYKSLKVVGALSIVGALLAGCGSQGDLAVKDNDSKTAVSAQQDQKEAAAPKKEKKPEIGVRTNPVPLGKTLVAKDVPVMDLDDMEKETVGQFEVSFDKVVRGKEAYAQVMKFNEFNEAPPKGFEYALVDVTLKAKIEDPNIAKYVSPSITVTGGDGSPVEQISTVVEPSFGDNEVYDGGTVKGKIALIVPEGDKDVLVNFDNDFSAFFKLN